MKVYFIGINSKYIHPAYGVYQIVANINSTQHNVSLSEFTIKDDNLKIIEAIISSNCDLLCFSVYIWNVEKIKQILKELENLNLNIKILLGGPEASFNASCFLMHHNVDYVIFQEGEEAFNELLAYFDNTITIDKVSNLYYKTTNTIQFTYNKLPDITKIKHNHLLVNDFKNRIVYVESSRGCYFKCSYCLASLEKSVRFFDINSVKDELQYLLSNNVKTIKFLDRSFNINKSYMLDLLSFLKFNDNNYTTIQFEIIGDALDDEVIDYIKNNIRSSLLRFEIGIQSTNEVTTKAVLRKQNFNLLKENITKLMPYVTIHVDLIAGLPYEDKQSFINTFNETFLLFADELQLGFLKELSGTLISRNKAEHGYIFNDTSPYEIISNNYITCDDLNEIRYVEAALEKLYNSANFKKTMNYLFATLGLNPYMLFLAFYNHMEKINLSLSSDHDIITSSFYTFLTSNYTIDNDYLLYIIKQDYLSKFKIRPKIWWQRTINKEFKRETYSLFISKYPELSLETLYRYGHLEIYKEQYYLILYFGTSNRELYI